ncbi:hypothetical protein AB0N77_20605 [Streptomyces misionensis]|uniref:hypothetical protein n=1 Tax=Streptomyces misionensis TaxID=67331 RepID=UPI003438B29E
MGQAGSGLLTDRLGQRTALILLMLLSAAACFALTLARSLPALLAVALLLGMTMEAHRPAVSAAINDAIICARHRSPARARGERRGRMRRRGRGDGRSGRVTKQTKGPVPRAAGPAPSWWAAVLGFSAWRRRRS